MNGRSTAVAIVAFDRPAFFRATLKSILANAPITACDLWLFLDGGEESCQQENRQTAEAELAEAPFRASSVRFVERPEKFGCGKNMIGARRTLFEEGGYERAFIFEDDLVVSPHYLGICQALLDWSEARFRDIGVVQAYNPCWLPAAEKVCRLDEVQVGNPHWWGYLMPRRTWDAIRDTLKEYEQRFLQGEYECRDSRAIKRWAREKIERKYALVGGPDNLFRSERCFPESWTYRKYFDGPFCTSQDSMTVLAMTLAGLQKLVTTVNRAQPIGSTGLHFFVERFVEDRFHEMRLDVFPSDASRTSFRPRSPAGAILPPMMRPDEVEAIRAVIRERRPRRILELGAGGSTVLFAREDGVQEWWSLEPSLIWIDSVLTACGSFPQVGARLVHCPPEALQNRLDELLPFGFDMFFVDGFDRPAALNRLYTHLQTAAGYVLLHDASRLAYQPQIEMFPRRTVLTEGDGRHQGLLLLEVPR